MAKRYPQKPNPFEGLVFNSPEWKEKIQELIKFKLDTLEEYEEKSTDISDDADYYEFCKFMDTCHSVWMVDSSMAGFLDNVKFPFAKTMFSTAGAADKIITKRALHKNIPKEDIPLIPILEYKLVPTGYVEYYDALISRKSREKRRYLRGERGLIAKSNEKVRERERRQEAREKLKKEQEESGE